MAPQRQPTALVAEVRVPNSCFETAVALPGVQAASVINT